MHDLSQPLAATRHERTDNQVPNVQGTERLVSLLGGGLLILGGLRRGGLTGCVKLALGAMALSRGVRQRCELKAALQPSPFEQALAERWGWRNPTAIQRSVTIAKPREEVFAYCTDLQHLRELLPFVDRIELGADGDRHQKCHAIDRYGCDPATRHLAGHRGPRKIHLRYHPTAVYIAETVGFAGQCGDL